MFTIHLESPHRVRADGKQALEVFEGGGETAASYHKEETCYSVASSRAVGSFLVVRRQEDLGRSLKTENKKSKENSSNRQNQRTLAHLQAWAYGRFCS